MKTFSLAFKDDTDKIIVVAMLIATMFFFFIPALLVILLLKNQVSENSYVLAKAVLNFELVLFLVSLIFMIPIIGWILGIVLSPIMIIANILIMVFALCSLAKNAEVKIPVLYEFI